MSSQFRLLLCAALLAGAAATPVHAAPQEPIQLVQAGDGQKSCEVLAGEINMLAAAEVAPPPRKKKGFGLGGLGKVLMVANPMMALAGGGMTGAVMSQAAGAAQQGAMQSAVDSQTAAAMNAMAGTTGIEAQRKARLLELFQAKGC